MSCHEGPAAPTAPPRPLQPLRLLFLLLRMPSRCQLMGLEIRFSKIQQKLQQLQQLQQLLQASSVLTGFDGPIKFPESSSIGNERGG